MNPFAPPKARVSDLPHDDRPMPWVTQLLALTFGVLCLGWGSALLYQRAALPLAAAGLCGLASLGLWLAKPWSRWVVYLFSTLLCSYSAWYFFVLWPNEGTTRSVAALIAGALAVLFGVTAAVYVKWVFRK